MAMNRREFLKRAGAGMGGTLAASSPLKPKASSVKSQDSAGMLYDTTICVGCKACQVACKRRSSLPQELDSQHIYEMPKALTADTWTLIKLYKGTEGQSFVKAQCMHCLEPACVSVCPVGALEKLPSGPVIYHDNKCIGCRYCMAACPYSIPKYQWYKVNPLIQKCDFCADRQAQGKLPACGEACPTGALIYGKRGQMIDIARKRIADSPKKYVNQIYGENEVGGASMLYVSHLPFEKLGLPALGQIALPTVDWPFMLGVPGIIVGMGGLMTAIYFITHRREAVKEAKNAAETR